MTKFHDIIRLAYEKGYRVSRDGKLYGMKGEELIVKKRGKQRYPTFSVNVGALTKSGVFGIPVHRFAAYCFYGEKMFEDGLVVRHLNGNVLDLRIENIKLGTNSENEHDKSAETRRRVGRIARAAQQRAMNSKFTDDEVREIRRRDDSGETGAAIARYLGVTRNCIYSIIKRRNYPNVS